MFHLKESIFQTQKTNGTTHKKRKWCTHCAKYVLPGEEMAIYIHRVHNYKVLIVATSPNRTQVVKINPKDVTDASVPHGNATFAIEKKGPCKTNDRHRCVICEKTFVSQNGLLKHMEWLQKIDLPHTREVVRVLYNNTGPTMGSKPLPMILESPNKVSQKVEKRKQTSKDQQGQATSESNNQSNKSSVLRCELCGRVAKTKKDMKYHLLQVHGMPIQKGAKTSRNKEANESTAQQESFPPPPSPNELPPITS
ncbi:hypothetical protein TNCV_4346671 [Trichonephila clavipes]|nr:hypothetical protein TNCV_4346671 [Trichonephila clavipes]